MEADGMRTEAPAGSSEPLHDQEIAQMLEKARRKERESLLASSGIPRRYHGAEKPSLSMPEGRGLYIWGPIGTGKTYAACAVGLREIAAGKSVLYATMADIQAQVRSTYDGHGDGTDPTLRYRRCGLLILDDLGKESRSDWATNLLYGIVDARYRDMLPMVVTSNYSIPEMAQRLAERTDDALAGAIASRLSEMCVSVHAGGKDRRIG